MPCCSPTIIAFHNTPSTTFGYGPSMVLQYGQAPKVDVIYWDGTKYVSAGIMTQIKFDTYPVTQVTVDHGGASSGLIKIS